MNIIPVMHCTKMKTSVAFYTGVLDFTLVGTWPGSEDPSYSILLREGAELHLSSHAGDGLPGNVANILVNNIDSLFEKYLRRGLDPSNKLHSPVHQGPLDQTWGTREFYVDDTDENVLRFIMRN